MDRPLFAITIALSIAIVASPIVPAIDLPQHVALAVQLRRLWDGDAAAGALYATNTATHNGGLHLLVAALSYVVPFSVAAKVVLAAYPPLLALGVSRVLAELGAPSWRARLVVPMLLGFSFAWGFANFVLGTALAWNLLASLLAQLRRPTRARLAAMLALSLGLGVVHVMATLFFCVTALAVGVEHLARVGASARTVRAVATAGVPLFAGPLWDVWVTRAHLAFAPQSYSSPPDGFDRFGPLRKLLFLGTHVAGTWSTYVDTALAWLVVAGLAALIAWRRRDVRSWTPLAVAVVGYFAVPPVFLNTHLVFQRLAGWIVLGLVVALPSLASAHERRLERASLAVALASLVVSLSHLVWFAVETSHVAAVVRHVPKGARVTGVVEQTRTASVKIGALTHVAALAVPDGALDEAFSFGRFLSMPVAYRAGGTVAPPPRSWEHGLGPYQAESSLARLFPVVVVRLRDEREPTDAVIARLFGARPARLLARDRDVLVIDARDAE